LVREGKIREKVELLARKVKIEPKRVVIERLSEETLKVSPRAKAGPNQEVSSEKPRGAERCDWAEEELRAYGVDHLQGLVDEPS